jgi:RNA polymerase sigma-70 factor (ECF subfamily)
LRPLLPAGLDCATVRFVSDDLELLRAWGEGDDQAGSVLVRRHFDTIARFFETKVEDNAADLIQRTFLACVRARDRAHEIEGFKAYLLAIARRQLMEHLRTKYRHAEHFQPLMVSVHDLGQTPSQAVAARQEGRLLLRALQRLPIEMQMTVELHYWEHLTEPQIAHVLDIPRGTVKSRLFRARELLREHIERLASSASLAESTLGGLDRWARELRDVIGTPSTPPDEGGDKSSGQKQ